MRVELKHEWSDGTSDLVFEPLELLGRLASFVPRPRTNLLIYHGIIAPNAKWRPWVVDYGRSAAQPHPNTTNAKPRDPRTRGRYRPWAELMRRAFDIDVLECTHCGGRMRLLATIEAPHVVRRILQHLRITSHIPRLAPPRAPPHLDASVWH